MSRSNAIRLLRELLFCTYFEYRYDQNIIKYGTSVSGERRKVCGRRRVFRITDTITVHIFRKRQKKTLKRMEIIFVLYSWLFHCGSLYNRFEVENFDVLDLIWNILKKIRSLYLTAGEKGDKGLMGQRGRRGRVGNPGSPGKDGIPGSPGERGANGIPGVRYSESI